jgi:hypothetical protein
MNLYAGRWVAFKMAALAAAFLPSALAALRNPTEEIGRTLDHW